MIVGDTSLLGKGNLRCFSSVGAREVMFPTGVVVRYIPADRGWGGCVSYIR